MDIESSQPDGITEAIKIKEQELRDRVHIKNREEEKKLEREREKERIRAGKALQEAKRIAEENERQRLVALRKIEKEEEKRAREKVLRKLEVDKLEQKRALGLPLENQAAKPRWPIAQTEEKNSLPVKSAKKDDRLRSLKLAYKKEMYADRVEEGAGKRSVKERLNGNSSNNFSSPRQITGKRQRQDDKWEHDLYQEDVPNVSNHKVDARDLRSKLQRKSLQNVSQPGRGTLPGVRDLREKLSGTMNTQPMNADPPTQKVKVAQQARKSVAVETPEPEPKRAASTTARKKAKQNVDTSVEGFLQSLGLEKYAITFQVEEVDMTALVHMTDEDLKALGIPMGPRKKIIIELESRR